jgi:hypothetical protein
MGDPQSAEDAQQTAVMRLRSSADSRDPSTPPSSP